MSNKLPLPPDDAPLPAASNPERRLLIRAALASGPVVASLASSRVLGASRCTAPSQTMSAAASIDARHRNQIGSCNGAKASVWADQSYPDTPGFKRSVVAFHSIFTKGLVSGVNRFVVLNNPNKGLSFQEVLNLGGKGGSAVAYAMCAAVLNVYAGRVSFPVGGVVSVNKMVGQLQQVWAGWISSGYRPYAGAPVWSDADILNYFYSQGIVAQG